MKVNHNTYSVILCGGKGERLWPYSTAKRTKPLIPFIGNKTLLEHTIDRCKVLKNKINIVTNTDQEAQIRKYLPLGIEKILVEPTSKNTAAAILFSCLKIIKENPDAIISFIPADAYIEDSQKFAHDLEIVIETAIKTNTICLLGLKPAYPATGYGYIEVESDVDYLENNVATNAKRFHEKPSKDIAQKYLNDKNKLWNLGIFSGRASNFIEEFNNLAPEIYEKVNLYVQSKNELAYFSIEPISFDHAILEKSKNISVIKASFDWCDVGNLDTFLSMKNANSKNENLISIDSSNNLVDTNKKIVALVGINNLCIIEQKDTLVIVERDMVEEVRKISKFIGTQKETSF